MSRWKARRTPRSNRLSSLRATLDLANRSGRTTVHREHVLEALEQRQLLAGDYPSFNQVFNTPTPIAVPEIVLNGTGVGSLSGVLATNGEDDMTRFTAIQDTFVTVWADTKSLGGTFDSRVEVYTGTPGGNPTLVQAGSTQGQLTSGVNSDGWVGFIAKAGTTYYVRTLSDSPTGTGNYNIRVDALPTNFPALNQQNGSGQTGLQTLSIVGGDIVFKLTTPSNGIFNSLMTINATADATDLDTHLDIYDSNGSKIISDELAGRLSNAFVAFKGGASQTYYVRVRSDVFATSGPNASTATGNFNVVVDGAATSLALDPVTRKVGPVIGNAGGQLTNSWSFRSQGTGLGFITVVQTGFPPIPDPAVHLYDETGTEIAFNDDTSLGGINAEIQRELIGNKIYYVLVEDFDDANAGTYAMVIESNHTWRFNAWDDHPNQPTGLTGDELRRAYERATPLLWNKPRPTTYINAGLYETDIRFSDRSLVVDASATGRIYNVGDTDVFKFTPQADMLGNYDGGNDDDGTSLYLGGTFTTGGSNTKTQPKDLNRIAAWDNLDYWAANLGLNGTIHAMLAWDPPDPDGPGPLTDPGQMSLWVAGEFTIATNSIDPSDPIRQVPASRIARFVFDPAQPGNPFNIRPEPLPAGVYGDYVWTNLVDVLTGVEGTNGAVRAMTIFDPPDPDGQGPLPDPPEILVLGGDFTQAGGNNRSRLATYNGYTFGAIGGGVNGRVNALAQWNPPDPDDPPSPGTPTPDPLNQLIIGGDFTQVIGGPAANRIVMYSAYTQPVPLPTPTPPWTLIGSGATNGANASVRAITVYSQPESLDEELQLDRIVFGGDFTTVAGQAANRVAQYRKVGTGFQASVFGGGFASGSVLALHNWDHDGDSATDNFVVAGGSMPGFIAASNGGAFGGLGVFNGAVRALTSFDDQDVGLLGGLEPGNELPELYVGGEFTVANGLPSNRVAKFEFNPNTQAFQWDPLSAGSGDTLIPGVNNSVNALAAFDDGNVNTWDRNGRQSSRLSIVVSPTVDAFIGQMTIQVLDSQFNVVFNNSGFAPNTPFGPVTPGSAGMGDPSVQRPNGIVVPGIEVWGGETYYIVVSANGTGRYELTVTADAYVTEDTNSQMLEPSGDPSFNLAPEIVLNDNVGDGVATLGTGDDPFAYQFRQFQQAATGEIFTQLTDYGRIETPGDTDLFFFTAGRSGTAEVRLNTTNITQGFIEYAGAFLDPLQLSNVPVGPPNPLPPVSVTRSKTISSSFDGALRIYDNDQNLIEYNDDFPTFGEYDVGDIGTFAGKTFFRRDPRVVFKVEEGKRYFIQVESAQLDAFLTGTRPYEIGWLSSVGAYELLINAMPNYLGIDDHENTDIRLATMIPIGLDAGPNHGAGSVTGQLKDVPINNPDDVDLFAYIAPANGTATITLESTLGSNLTNGILRLFNDSLQLVGSVTQNGNQPATLQVNTSIGERFYVQVDGDGGQPGQLNYRVSVSGLPYFDDHGDYDKWDGATDINRHSYDYDGIETVAGKLEVQGDTDVFRFETIAFEDGATIEVQSLSNTLRPLVRIFEVSVDLANNAYTREIGNATAAGVGPGLTGLASVSLPLTGPNRTTPVTPPPTQNTYNYYYILVTSFDPNVHHGNYTVTVKVDNKTDDHPDVNQTIQQWALATSIPINAATGKGAQSGIVNPDVYEFENDNDVFTFQAPAAGPVTITIASPSESSLRPRVRVYDKNFQPLTDLTTNSQLVIGPDVSFSVAEFKINAERDTAYYIIVDGVGGGLVKNAATGAYNVLVVTPILDDHANANEFNFATVVPLSSFTGDADDDGVIDYVGDSDLFKTTSLIAGKLTFKYSTPASFVTPVISLFDANGVAIGSSVVDGGVGDEDGVQNGTVVRSIVAGDEGISYFIMITASPTGPVGNQETGSYLFRIDGPVPTGVPIDDHANAGQFSQASPIQLGSIDGNGTIAGVIGVPIDTDLFTFTTVRGGKAFIQVVTPKGQVLDTGVRLFDQNENEIAFDVLGNAAANSYLAFDATASTKYYVLVEGDNSNTGSYDVRVSVQPQVSYLYFPEGFANNLIREYLSIANGNAYDVNYTIRLRYETGAPETVLVNNAVIKANSRSGATTSRGAQGGPAPGVLKNTPYAIVIESDGPLGATFSHYDFNSPLGEAFTSQTSTTWTFPKVQRQNGIVRDYLLAYNPNDNAVRVVLTAHTASGDISLVQTIQAHRRGGWSINKALALPVGTFAVTLSSAPINPGDDHIGIVASLSHYDLAATSGDASLGDHTGGSTDGVIPGLINNGGDTTEIDIFNPGNTAASVTLTGVYINSGLPNITRNVTIAPKTTMTFTGTDLSLAVGSAIGIRYTSDVPVTVLAREIQFNDANATLASTHVGTNFFFGDAFINVPKAGISYLENLYFYNPANEAITITLDVLFSDATKASTTLQIQANNFNRVELHKLPEILNKGGKVFFSLQLSSNDSFAVTMNHYDLILQGGWGTQGAPLGLTNALSSF